MPHDRKPGDALGSFQYQLDGWSHRVKEDQCGPLSVMRIPAPVDPVNWRPLSADEKELFSKRIEKAAKVFIFLIYQT